ncbi:hypothetical protein BO71DRAFT_206920 [Aspergillus ellipticus CBS 707.79]|uniref:Uncharacterized protein n=1 Tax=Aspergillus ellipticus CBS 707.79 TaxID=1448320 RepID=A0A319DP52_9EURO|nr:hypothetical protein BO71DRAFT_206920 [Aspergillus ellipticus CBS 707.79]
MLLRLGQSGAPARRSMESMESMQPSPWGSVPSERRGGWPSPVVRSIYSCLLHALRGAVVAFASISLMLVVRWFFVPKADTLFSSSVHADSRHPLCLHLRHLSFLFSSHFRGSTPQPASG